MPKLIYKIIRFSSGFDERTQEVYALEEVEWACGRRQIFFNRQSIELELKICKPSLAQAAILGREVENIHNLIQDLRRCRKAYLQDPGKYGKGLDEINKTRLLG